MNYELAKKLKDAGFSQEGYPKGHMLLDSVICGMCNDKHHAYAPTLSELIEACGTEFNFVCRDPRTGRFGAEPVSFQDLDTLKWSGFETPEEAVVNVWLSINKK